MSAQAYDHAARQYERAGVLAAAAIAAPAGKQLGLKALGPKMAEDAARYAARDAAVRQAQNRSDRDEAAAQAAHEPVVAAYEEYRVVADGNGCKARPAATKFNTRDDFLRSAGELKADLESGDNASWAAPLAAQYAPAYETASRAHAKAADAKKALELASDEREAADAEVRPRFVLFRRAVRATFGPTSRAYRELRDKRYGSSAAPSEPDEPSDPTPDSPAPNK